jgi:hypothetical protein
MPMSVALPRASLVQRLGLSHGIFVYVVRLAPPSIVVVLLWGCGTTQDVSSRRIEPVSLHAILFFLHAWSRDITTS